MECLDSKPVLTTEVVKTPEANGVSICVERGGIITSLKFRGIEVLYLDEATLPDTAVNVRGGIPILFPNAGPIESSKYPNLKQHGFARLSSRWSFKKHERGFTETLMSDTETIHLFPHHFRFSVDGRFEHDGSLLLTQEVENLQDDGELPLSMGLHPYFKVPQDKKGDIKFNFEGGKFVEEEVETWTNGEAVSIDNPKVKDPNAVMEVTIPNLGTLVIDASVEYQKIWIWSMSEKDFVCIEPVMRGVGGLTEDPEKIAPSSTFFSSVRISLKE